MIAETVPPTSASSIRRRMRSTEPTNCPSTATAEAGIGVAKVGRVSLVDGTQVVEILRSRPFVPALIGGEQRLAEPRLGPALVDIPGTDLGDHISERDPKCQAAGPDPGGPGGRTAFIVDLPC